MICELKCQMECKVVLDMGQTKYNISYDWHVMIPACEYYDKTSPILSRVKNLMTRVFECILCIIILLRLEAFIVNA